MNASPLASRLHSAIRVTLLASLIALCVGAGCAKVTGTTRAINRTSVNTRGSGLSIASVSTESLQGSWSSTCAYDSVTEAYYHATVVFQAETMMTETLKFLDSQCADQVSSESRTSAYAVGPSNPSTNKTLLSETLSSVKFTPLTGFTANEYNQSKFCGVTDWVANSAQTFLAVNVSACQQFTANPAYFAELYGNAYLYLDTCDSQGSQCTTVQFSRGNH